MAEQVNTNSDLLIAINFFRDNFDDNFISALKKIFNRLTSEIGLDFTTEEKMHC